MHEEMFNTLNVKRNANQNYTKILYHPSQIGHHQENKQVLKPTIHVCTPNGWRWAECLLCLLSLHVLSCVINLLSLSQKKKENKQQMLKIDLPYPTIPLLSICPKECKSIYKTDTCTPRCATLFTIAELWNQLRCPKTEWRQCNKTHHRLLEKGGMGV
jgi:hypothetical protein